MLKDFKWALWSVLALLCFATNNFLLDAIGTEAVDKSHANISGIFLVWAVAGVCGLGAFVALGPSTIVKGAKGVKNALTVLLTGVINTLAMTCLSLALAADPASAGPITAMLPLSSLLVSSLAWFFLGEKLGPQEFLGIAIAILGPVLMALADTSGVALHGLLFGALTACCFGTSNFLRKLVVRQGAAWKSVVVYLFLSVGLCAVVALSSAFISGRGLKGIDDDPKLIVFALGSGFLWVIGGICFQFALMGKAGPASAVTNTNSVGVLLLQIIFFQPALKPLKLAGMGVCLVGVTILSLKKPPPPAAAPEPPPLSVSLHERP